jgi:hypothetical protein
MGILGREMFSRVARRIRLGDKIEAGLAHIPAVKKLPCYDKSGTLNPESRCGQRKRILNGE